MRQSRRMSLAESLSNIAIGYGVAIVTQIVVFPWYHLAAPIRDNLQIGGIFTVVSFVRSYCIRRAFNALRNR